MLWERHELREENKECCEKDMSWERKDNFAERCEGQEVIWRKSNQISWWWSAKFVGTLKDFKDGGFRAMWWGVWEVEEEEK